MEDLNKGKKDYYPPMHTAEHLLNQTMIRFFGCGRSQNAHIETKKSKCDYVLNAEPSQEELAAVENTVNEVIGKGLFVRETFLNRSQAEKIADLSKLPGNVSEPLRIVSIGDYDHCACIGKHVSNTAEIGTFSIVSHGYENGILRLRWKVL